MIILKYAAQSNWNTHNEWPVINFMDCSYFNVVCMRLNVMFQLDRMRHKNGSAGIKNVNCSVLIYHWNSPSGALSLGHVLINLLVGRHRWILLSGDEKQKILKL